MADFAFRSKSPKTYGWDTMVDTVYPVSKRNSVEHPKAKAEMEEGGWRKIRTHPNGVRHYEIPPTEPMGGHSILEVEADSKEEAASKFRTARSSHGISGPRLN